MRAAATIAILAALCVALPAPAKSKPKKTPAPAPAPAGPPHVEIVRVRDGWRADLAFDGPLLGWALPRTDRAHRSLFVLIGSNREASGETPATCRVLDPGAAGSSRARLYRWQPQSPDRLEMLGSELPAGSLDAADLDGDGRDELVLQRDGRIDLVTILPGGDAGTPALVEDAAIGTSCCGPRASWERPAADDTALRVTVLGAFRSYHRDSNGSTAIVSELAIPLRASGGAERVRVQSPMVHTVGRATSGRMLFATEPEPQGKRRLRSFVLDPDGPPETRRVESWAMLPGAERMIDHAQSVLDGAPVLIVTTTSAEKLSLLGEKALRVYPMSGDRTRAGNDPIFAATTGINLWQRAIPAVVDLDGDGRQDLVLAYWKGLKNSIAALEVYRGVAPSGFARSRSMSFDVDQGDKGFMDFGADVDGDGRPDLVLRAQRELLVFPGTTPERAAARPVATTPSRRIALPADLPAADDNSVSLGIDGPEPSRTAPGLGTPHLLDLDADGRPEAVFAGNGAGGGRIVVVSVRGSS